MKQDEKMRLIDANRLCKRWLFKEAKGAIYRGTVESMPTVEAIPVQWILDHAVVAQKNGEENIASVLFEMIQKWRDEND